MSCIKDIDAHGTKGISHFQYCFYVPKDIYASLLELMHVSCFQIVDCIQTRELLETLRLFQVEAN